MDLNFEIDESEVFRMLGARGKENDSIKALVCQAIKSVTENAVPRAVYRKVEREALRPLLLGHDIETHLKKCDSVVALACTLGSEIDRLIRSLQISDMALAVVVDAAASVAIGGRIVGKRNSKAIGGTGLVFDRSLLSGIWGLHDFGTKWSCVLPGRTAANWPTSYRFTSFDTAKEYHRFMWRFSA
ncbi:hypothetical protein [uncultured Ruthenibacterium sp.]|uniref:hypothetical protein n=1 Tax=uncultured Ruthenibacterium sp. TaxID=1905347 RepID=UPI00349EAF86